MGGPDAWAWSIFYDSVLIFGALLLVLGTISAMLLLLMVVFSDYIRPFAKETFSNMRLWVRGEYSVLRAWRGSPTNGQESEIE